MSRFYASIEGNRGPATRQGTPNSGISGHIRGWNVGVRVEGEALNGEDVFEVFATSGSNGQSLSKFIATIRVKDGQVEVTHAQPSVERFKWRDYA